jgi:hypothetical protein
MEPAVLILYVTTGIGLILSYRIRPVLFLLLVSLLLITSLNETWLTVLQHDEDRNNFYNWFSLIEIVIWSVLLIENNNYTHKWLHYILVSLILVASVTEISYRPGFHHLSYRAFSAYAVASALFYFYRLSNNKTETSLLTNGRFWMFTAVMIFQLVFAFYLSALNMPEFANADDAMNAFRTVFDTVNIIYYFLLAYALICFSFYRQ